VAKNNAEKFENEYEKIIKLKEKKELAQTEEISHLKQKLS